MNPASNLIRAPFYEKAFPPRSCSTLQRSTTQNRRNSFHSNDKRDHDASSQKRDRVTKSMRRWLRLGNCVIGGGRHGHCPCTPSGHCCWPLRAREQVLPRLALSSGKVDRPVQESRYAWSETQAPNMHQTCFESQGLHFQIWVFVRHGIFLVQG